LQTYLEIFVGAVVATVNQKRQLLVLDFKLTCNYRQGIN